MSNSDEGTSIHKSKLMMVIVPLVIFSIGLLQIIWYSSTMELKSTIDVATLPERVLLTAIAIIIILIFQRIIEERVAYFLLMVGMATWLFGRIENVMDEFYNIVYGIPLDIEDLTPYGLIIAGFGLAIYARMLMITQRMLEQHQKETELYATLLRHDLSNDLQALTGYVEAALMFSDDIPQNVLGLLQSAQVAGIRMSRLIKAFAAKRVSEPVELVDLIKSLASDAEIANRGLKVKVDALRDVGSLRTYGSALLPAAFENLFRNAHEYAGPNPVVEIRVGRIHDDALILFSDSGSGIPPDVRAQIFTRGVTDSDRGLGLYLTRTILRACGGDITMLDESAGKGARFRITIPILA
ncbi:MAG: HAMP domain-containing sensor histidine kinase [Candidatus Thorarchaeota archaeon]